MNQDISPEKQQQLWEHGTASEHVNLDDGSKACVPDFSCCCPELAWPLNTRGLYLKSDAEKQLAMLTESLHRLFQKHGPFEATILMIKLAKRMDFTAGYTPQ